MRVRWALFALLLLAPAPLASCRVSPARPTTDEGAGLSAFDTEPPEVAVAFERLWDGKPTEALEGLEAAGGLDVNAPQRSWLLLDLHVARGDSARARALTDALPDVEIARVLRWHVAHDPEARLRGLARSYRGAAAAYAHLEAARALADLGESPSARRAHVAQARALGSVFVRREASLVEAHASLADGDVEAALLAALAAADDDAGDPRPPAAAARAAARLGRTDEAAAHAVRALRLAPASGRAARRVADLVRGGLSDAAVARLRTEVALVARSPRAGAEAVALRALLDDRAGDAPAAIDGYRRALAAGADPVPVDRDLRRRLFAAGRHAEALALLRDAVPPDAFTDPRNLRASAWAALRRAGDAVGASPAATPAARLDLARALVGVGALPEALGVLEGLPDPASADLRTRVESQRAFEADLRRLVEEGYRARAAKAPVPSIRAFLASAAEAARRRLPPDEAADVRADAVGLRDLPMLGAWLDHGAATTSPLVARFRRYGKYLVLGQRSGEPVEAILLSLASLTAQQEIPTQGRVFHHDVAIGYDREISSLVDQKGGALSGAALPDGVWLDADAARREEHALRAGLAAVDAGTWRVVDRLGASPPATDGIDGPLAMDDDGAVGLRLARRYVARSGAYRWGAFDVLRAHESAHVLDLDRHLPILAGLPATIALLAGAGFAFGRVEARLEARAQRAAVLDSPWPELALLEMVRAATLSARAPEAHDRGYRHVVAEMVRGLADLPLGSPRVDPTRKLLAQLDRLSPEEIRELARRIGEPGPIR